MGVLTPLAVRIGATPWMPRMLPLIESTDMRLHKLSKGRVSLLDIAGLPNLLLRVPGRKSGVIRSTPLLCAPVDDAWLIAGSYFGNPALPTWVINLRASGTAEIVIHGTPITVIARELPADERSSAWQQLVHVWPNFRLYEQRTDRTIPVFRLTRS